MPWKDLDIDVVVESTGFFDSYDKAKAHLDAGAKRVVITAPVKDDMAITFTPNVYSEDISKSKITSNASCTTNAITPLISILAKIRVSKSGTKHHSRLHGDARYCGQARRQRLAERPGRTIDIAPSSTGSGHFRHESHSGNERNF